VRVLEKCLAGGAAPHDEDPHLLHAEQLCGQ